jgi:hypothetical protein
MDEDNCNGVFQSTEKIRLLQRNLAQRIFFSLNHTSTYGQDLWLSENETTKISCRNASSALVRQLAPIFGSPVKALDFCGPLISGARRMTMATRSDTWQDTCDFLSFRLHTSRQQHLEAPTSNFPSRVPNGGAPVEAPPPACFYEFHRPFGVFCLSSWLICGLLRSPAPCTRPQPC